MPGNSLLFSVHSCLSNPRGAFRLRRLAESGGLAQTLVATAHFRAWWSLFVAGARETLCFGVTFHDGFTWKCSFGGRCSTLDMVVIFDAL